MPLITYNDRGMNCNVSYALNNVARVLFVLAMTQENTIGALAFFASDSRRPALFRRGISEYWNGREAIPPLKCRQGRVRRRVTTDGLAGLAECLRGAWWTRT